jgi:uncharacterized repeat protein (TIGR04076 family)
MVSYRISKMFCGIITSIITIYVGKFSEMARPKIKITVKERKGAKNCHRGHKVGDSYDFDTERGKICPMVMHVLFPVIDILRYGGSLPARQNDLPRPDDSVGRVGLGDGCSHKGLFACPDPDVLLVFEVEKVSGEESELPAQPPT